MNTAKSNKLRINKKRGQNNNLKWVIRIAIELDEAITTRRTGNSQKLAQLFGVSRTTIHKYLEALSEVKGKRIQYHEGGETYKYVEECEGVSHKPES